VALVVGAALRVWYLVDLLSQPFFGHLLVDARAYDASALAILAGRGLEVAFYRPPLYPLFLAGIYGVAGHSMVAVVAAQMLLGLACVVPVFLLAQRWYGGAAGTVAALVTAAYPLRIYYEGEHLDVTLVSFLLLAAVWAAVTGIAGRSAPLLGLTGTLLGASALVRPNILAVLPFLALGCWLLSRGTDPLPRRGVVIGATLLLLVLAPTTIRNWRAEGRLIPVAAYGGINFFLGNTPGATGETPMPPGLRWEELALLPVREGFTGAAAQDAWWWRKATAQIAADPVGTLLLLGKKTALFWNIRESSNNKALPFFTAVSPVTAHYRWWFGILAVVALSTLPFTRANRGTGLLLCLLAGVTCSVIPFFVTARYRIPAVPLLAILAGGGAVALARTLHAGRRGGGVAPMGWAMACSLAILVPWFGTTDRAVDADLQMALVRMERGEPELALPHLLAAIKRDPDDPDRRNIMGVAQTALGDLPQAEEAYRQTLSLGEFSSVYFNLGLLRQRQGDAAGAEAFYRRTLELNPLNPKARRNLELLRSGVRE
jgi:4-amino-4-deoxy-L-arabinose transferase-like glycosyltransferase